jgi:hypothetical protein
LLLVNDSWYADNSGGYWVTIEKGQRTPVGPKMTEAIPPATAPVYSQSPEVTALQRDNVFGHALASGIGLTHRIEASVDLMNWVVATNVVFYFKDLDSPSFRSRFYRFPGP